MDIADLALCVGHGCGYLWNALSLVSIGRNWIKGYDIWPLIMDPISKMEGETPATNSGLLHPDRLDAMAYDENRKAVILAMFETRPWDLGELQLLQLQEKLNAYASFILDGEMRESYPELIDQQICIQLRTVYEPSDAVLSMTAEVRDQLALQDIEFEVVVISDDTPSCG